MDDELFRGRLLTGERILWSGRPQQGLLFMPRDVYLVPFSLAWCGFAIFWTVTAAAAKAPGFFPLWGGMFVAIGLYFVIGRFVVDALIRRGLRYAVTDRRVLIARPLPLAKFSVLNLAQLPDIDLSERSNGSGTIRFGRTPASPWSGNSGMSGWTPSLDPTPQFLGIEQARRVFDLIQRANNP